MLIAFIGEQTQEQENQITILKGCRLLETIGDHQVTKEDLTNLKSSGIEHLRVPIGYWMLGEPYLKV